VLLRTLSARLDGLTDRVEIHQSISPAPLTGFLYWAVTGSSKEQDMLIGSSGPAVRKPNPTYHARFSQNSFKMRLFDIRHPSRGAAL
jgi:hypothetical protein